MSNTDVSIGLVTSNGDYLTAEPFRNLVSLVTTVLGPKQIWDVEFKSTEGVQVQVELKAFNGLSLQTDINGFIKCAPSNELSLFLLEYQSNGSWVFKSSKFGTYLESNGDKVFCSPKDVASPQQWIPHLSMHPQIALYHLQSKSYVRMHYPKGQAIADAPAPFSEECIFLFHFDHGKYHLQTSNLSYLSTDGQLLNKLSKQTAFDLHLKAGYMVSLSAGKKGFLFPHQRSGLFSAGLSPSDMEAVFIIKRPKPWITLKTSSNKYVTVNYGVEVYARSENITDLSLFQFEANLNSNNVRLRTVTGQLLVQRRQANILANGDDIEEATYFTLKWNNSKISLQAANKLYLKMKPIGQIMANAAQPGPNEEFTLRLMNRPFLILRGKCGYIATDYHSAQLRCSQSKYEIILLTLCKGGFYHFQGK
ncbi:fascin-3-like [Rhinoraja longicauda]